MCNSNTPLKICRKCQVEYPATNEYFSKAKENVGGLSHICKTCKKAYNRNYHLANRGEIRSRQRDYYSERQNEIKERRNKTYRDNPEASLAQSAAYYKEHHVAIRNMARVREAKKRAMSMDINGDHAIEDVERIYIHQDGRCIYCGISLYWELKRDITVDHVMPLTRGGSNDVSNIVISCLACNQSKSNKTYDEWVGTRGW